MKDAIALSGLYKCHRKKDGKLYLSGKINRGLRLLILPDDHAKEGEPQFKAFLVPVVDASGAAPEAVPADRPSDRPPANPTNGARRDEQFSSTGE